MSHYYEAQVVFEKTFDTKNGPKTKQTRENYLVEGSSVTYVEAQVAEFLKDCHDPFEVKIVKESKIIEVLNAGGGTNG
tara:strand:+ start:564 stop:797 length:234 start_codon:yes stop_codon:yes gene_type:complete